MTRNSCQLVKRQDNQKALIIYHGNCIDGMTACWVMWNYLKGKVSSVETHAAEYQNPFPKTDASTVYVVDFSYPRDVILEERKSRRVVIIDHHASAIAKIKDLEDTYLDTERSGAMLALNYAMEFLGAELLSTSQEDQDLIKFVTHVQDRDLNRMRLTDTASYHAWLTSKDMTLQNWNAIIRVPPRTIVQEGFAMDRYHKGLIGKLINNNLMWWDIPGFGKGIPVLNTTKEFGGDACNEILTRYLEPKFALYFYNYEENGKEYRYYGARSKPDHNLIPMAQHFGGGGHPQASAWRGEPDLDIRINDIRPDHQTVRSQIYKD